jgi:nicotinamidase/pyrazinamidase
MKKILFLIDCQKDFMDGGKLGVDNSTKKMDELAQYIRDSKGQYDAVLASVDWHPNTHCSFKPNGGMWPPHCLQYSEGAAIYEPILNAIDEIGVDFHVFTKGVNEDREEYSVMKNGASNKAIHAFIDSNSVEAADFAGIAGDYCVKDSVADFHREIPNVTITVLEPFCPSIDGGTALLEFLKKNDEIICATTA